MCRSGLCIKTTFLARKVFTSFRSGRARCWQGKERGTFGLAPRFVGNRVGMGKTRTSVWWCFTAVWEMCRKPRKHIHSNSKTPQHFKKLVHTAALSNSSFCTKYSLMNFCKRATVFLFQYNQKMYKISLCCIPPELQFKCILANSRVPPRKWTDCVDLQEYNCFSQIIVNPMWKSWFARGFKRRWFYDEGIRMPTFSSLVPAYQALLLLLRPEVQKESRLRYWPSNLEKRPTVNLSSPHGDINRKSERIGWQDWHVQPTPCHVVSLSVALLLPKPSPAFVHRVSAVS